MKTSHTKLPLYDVEFVPLERRMSDRRRHADPSYAGPERRKYGSRRNEEVEVLRPDFRPH